MKSGGQEGRDMAGYLDDAFVGSMLPAKREPIKAEVVYTPRRKRTYRARVEGDVPAVRQPSSNGGMIKTRKPRKTGTRRATVEAPPSSSAPPTSPPPQPTVDSDAEFRKKAAAVGKFNEKRRNQERKLEESQFQRQLRHEAALAKRKERARQRSLRKHKKIARKIWRRLV
jgi:hypothetical protein